MPRHGRTKRALKRLLAFSAAAAGLGAGAYAAYFAVTWSRYGSVPSSRPADPLLDRFLGEPEVREVHEVRVQAPADLTFEAARHLDLHHSFLVRAIFRGRELFMGARPEPRKPAALIDETRALGWGVLADVPGRAMVLGAVTQPWEADVRFRSLPPESFAAFAEPGHAKIVWSVTVERLGPAESLFRTETRVMTTDPASRARFRRYWAAASPGILLIRREALRLVRVVAEHRWAAFRERRDARAVL